jgi:hypothetical protein
MDSTNSHSLNLSQQQQQFIDEVDTAVLHLYELVRIDNRIPYNKLIITVSWLRELSLSAYERGKEEALKEEAAFKN